VVRVHAGDDLIADLPDRRVVVAEKPRFHFLLPRAAAVLHQAHERDVAADILPQQLVRLEQVVLVVLLEDVQARRFGQRSEVHGRRIHRGGDVHESQVEGAARQLQVANVAHEREVRVVDRECQLGLVVQRRRVLTLNLRLGRTGRGAIEVEGHGTCK
jgi:hypothetical protein